jgi:hypothetical protein
MSVQTATTIFFAIASVMWIVWLLGARFALSRLRPRGAWPGPEPGGGDLPPAAGLDRPEGPESLDAVVGEAEVEGGPEAVSRKLAEQLAAATSPGGASVFRITERTPRRVTFRRAPGQGPVFDEGIVALEPRGGRVKIRYAVSLRRLTAILRIATYLVCFGYGGLFVVGAPALIWYLVVNSECEAVRWQVFQTFQMVHGVWPPFLMGALALRLRRTTARFFESLVANMEHIV